MPSYRLLRSNKESGPYSLSDLLKLGLKPYDLIWVDGRSAAWRYSSEVAELEAYAPAVEEQPYDRFFKKPSEKETPKAPITPSREQIIPEKETIHENFAKEETVHRIVKESNGESSDVKKLIPEIPVPAYSSFQPQPKKKVFVSMPETMGFELNRDQYENQKQEQYEKYEQYLPKSTPVPSQQKQMPAEERSYSPINIQESDESKLETKYTQSLDDIKEMYINTLVQRKTRNRRKEIFKKYVRPALVPLFLLIAGVAIGYIITIKKNSLQASQPVAKVIPQQNNPDQNNDTVAADHKDAVPADNKILQPDDKERIVAETDNKKERGLHDQEQASIEPQKQRKDIETFPKAVLSDRKQQETFIPDNEVSTIQKKSVEVDPATGERKKVVRDNYNEVTPIENNNKSNPERVSKKNSSEPQFLENDNNHKDIHDLVAVRSNEYLRGAFGGIRGLELTVYNNSNFLLDEVSVELQIMKPSEQPLRTDIITFRNIAANGKITVKVPDSQRGIRVDYHITNIESKQWQKSTAGL